VKPQLDPEQDFVAMSLYRQAEVINSLLKENDVCAWKRKEWKKDLKHIKAVYFYYTGRAIK
jgi:hypothetical protein